MPQGSPRSATRTIDSLPNIPPLMMQLGALPLLFLNPEFPYEAPVFLADGKTVDLSKTGSKFLYEMGNDPRLILFLERIPIVLVTVFAGALLFLWARELYGLGGAFLSLALFAFCPNVLAHGSLYTTDMGVTAMFFGTIYGLKKFFERPSAKRALFTGILFGLALLSKASAVLLFPLGIFFFALFLLEQNQEDLKQAPVQSALERYLAKALAVAVFIPAVSHKTTMVILGPLFWIVISSWFKKRAGLLAEALVWSLFLGLAFRLRKHGVEYQAAACLWVSAAASLSFWVRIGKKDAGLLLQRFACVGLVASLVVGLGYLDFFSKLSHGKVFSDFLRSFHIASSHSLTTAHIYGVGGSFIHVDWRYFILLALVKTPLAVLILFPLGALGLAKLRIPKVQKLLVFLTPVMFLMVASFLNQIRIGLRHVLPVYPFLFLMAGGVPELWRNIRMHGLKQAGWGAVLALVLFSSFRTLSVFPHYVSYFNEWVVGVEQGAKLTTDSNLLWGQDNRRFADQVRERGIGEISLSIFNDNQAEWKYYGVNWKSISEEEFKTPKPGFYGMDVGLYASLQARPDSWFRGRRPDFRAGPTIYVFRVPESRA